MTSEDIRAHYGIIIPAFNAEGFLGGVLEDLLRWAPADKILVVDDGSSDRTGDAPARLGIACLRHDTNSGKGSALMTGMQWARRKGWEWAITMDADGQHAPSDLPRFWDAPVARDTAVAVGCRGRTGAMPMHRRFSNHTTTFMISLLAGGPVYDAQSGYRMYRIGAVEGVLPMQGRFEWEAQALVLFRRRGFTLLPVPITTLYTGNGTHMRLWHDTVRFLKMYWRLAWMP